MLYATTLAALWKCPCFEFQASFLRICCSCNFNLTAPHGDVKIIFIVIQVYHWNPCDPEVSLFKKHLLFSAEKNVCGTCSKKLSVT
uniref:Uncharacterized protein n=1 Tax=Solanum lycopersicum TaxID=4081 RepID=A0A3Q7G5K2_SOLLC